MRDEQVEIWLLEDKDRCYDTKTGNPVPIYVYEYKGAQPEYPPGVVKRKDGKKASLEELVGLCDQDAESINAHDFCGSHRLLGAVLYRHLGRKRATEIMLDIAERRGLHGMGGICGTHDSYDDLRVGENGRDWDGNYDEE